VRASAKRLLHAGALYRKPRWPAVVVIDDHDAAFLATADQDFVEVEIPLVAMHVFSLAP
jgi:hypothetical protein